MTIEDINQQYNILAAKAGDLAYKIRQHEEALKQIYEKIDKLNELAAHVNNVNSSNAVKDAEAKNE